MVAESYRAYVVPEVDIDGKSKNIVLRSLIMTRLSAWPDREIFLVEGERAYKSSFLNFLVRGSDFRSSKEFIASLKKDIEEADIYRIEERLGDFSSNHNLRLRKFFSCSSYRNW